MKISFCLITLNEEANLRRCLESCRELADEIVVVDSGSTDGSAAIAAEFEARWHEQKWLGYVGQKNLALSQARCEWVFSIDADEELSPKLRQEIQEIKAKGSVEELSGFSMPRCVLYEGRWIRHGDWYPDRLVRLFRKQKGRFEGGKVHERLEVKGRIIPLAGELHHYSFKDEQDHWQRCQKYAQLWAESQFELGRSPGMLSPLSHSIFRWFRAYILKRGFLDGKAGWTIACFSAREVYLKYKLLRAMYKD